MTKAYQTKIYPAANCEHSQAMQAIELAGQYINQGEIVGFPTETVYGLGADALNPEAVAKIFVAKGRPADNPLICHINALNMAEQIADFTPLGRTLAQKFWPGPLTIVLPRKEIVPDITTAGLDSVAIRYPLHPIALALIAAAAKPIAAPSANLSGRPSPTTALHVWEDMAGKIPLILDGEPVQIGLESTVVDARGEKPLLLRPGQITAEELAECCGDCLFPQAATDRPPSPGMKYRHYAPKGQLYLAEDAAEALLIAQRLPQTPLFLVSRETARQLLAAGVEEQRIRALFGQDDLATYAQVFFSELRQADEQKEAYLIAEKVAKHGLGLAIMNRLEKAACK